MHIESITSDEVFLAQTVRNKQHIIIAFVREEYNEIAHNWYLLLKKYGHHTDSLLICMDEESYSYAKKQGIPCIHVNQDKVISSIDINPFKNAWKLPFHICQALVIEYITQKFNIDIIRLDVDMCILKKNFIEKIYAEMEEGFDICIHTNVHYKDLKQSSISASQNGGMILLWTPAFVKKFIENIKNSYELNIDAPSVHTTLEDIGQAFGIKGKKLHPYFFTNTTFWDVDEIREFLQHIAFIVHYNMLRDVTRLNSEGLKDLASLKISLMKKHGLWLVDGG
jgi:hypothetical protein